MSEATKSAALCSYARSYAGVSGDPLDARPLYRHC